MLEQMATSQPTNLDWATVRRLLGYLRGDERILGAGLIMLIVTSASQAIAPTLIGQAVDQFISQGDRTGLARTMLLLLGTYLLGYVGWLSQLWYFRLAAQRMLKRLRLSIFEHVQRLSLGYFSTRGTGDLMSRLVNDTQVIGNLFADTATPTLVGTFTLIGIVIAMFALNWQLALVTFTIIPAMFWITRFFSRRARGAYRETRETLGHLSEHLEEDLSSVREAQAFARTGLNIAHFEQDNAAYRDASIDVARITSAFSPTMDVLSMVATVLVAGVGGWLAFNDTITVGVVVAFLAYTGRFFWPVQQMSKFYVEMQSALAASDRVFEMLDTPPAITNQPEATALPEIAGHVRFEAVTFGYKQDEPVLNGLSFEAQPGQTVALVGPTGAGKSTVVNLIGRFYEVTGGRVMIDHQDVREVTVESLRGQIGEVPQDSFLFADTIANNLRYGQPQATLDQVIAAAKAANAHDFITELPNGYETLLGERGTSISQGQRQLLCIARALLAAPRLLILDEATSNIDTRTERLVQSAIDTLLAGRTAFVIAHRLSTIRTADQIMVIDRGRVAERGSHDQLLAQGGQYADLYRKQMRATT